MSNPGATQAFRSVPQGFFTANETLNSYSTATFTQLVLDLLQSLSSQSGSVSPARYVELTGLSAPIISSTIQALSFIFRLFISNTVTNEQVSPLLAKETDLSEEKRELIQTLWADYNKVRILIHFELDEDGELLAPSKTSVVGRTLSLGGLVGFSWRIGVGISSSNCTNLAAPFVTLAFEITTPTTNNQNTSTNTSTITPTSSDQRAAKGTQTFLVECTHHEFEEVRKHFQDIFNQLDSI